MVILTTVVGNSGSEALPRQHYRRSTSAWFGWNSPDPAAIATLGIAIQANVPVVAAQRQEPQAVRLTPTRVAANQPDRSRVATDHLARQPPRRRLNCRSVELLLHRTNRRRSV